MPGGKVTTSADRYCREWRKLYKPLENEFGLTLIGCDPSFLFRKKNEWGGSFDLPLWFVEKLLILIDKQKTVPGCNVDKDW